MVSLRFAYFNVFNLFLFFPTPNWHDNGKKPTEFSSKNNEHNEILRETFNCSITHCPCRFYWHSEFPSFTVLNSIGWIRQKSSSAHLYIYIDRDIEIFYILSCSKNNKKKTIGETFLFVFDFTGLQMLCFYHHLSDISLLKFLHFHILSDNYFLSSNTYVSNTYLTRRYTSKKSIL